MKKVLFIAVLSLSIMFTSCAFLDNLANNLSSIANLANCEYSLKNVSNVSVAGVNVRNITKGNISATDVVMLASALTSKRVPLSLDVNINVKNPTQHNALLTTMDWALDVSQKEFATGTTTQNYNINAGSVTAVPLGVSTDLYQLFSRDGINALKAFASSFSNDGTSSQLGLRVRPSVQVAGQVIKSPSYIQIMKPATAASTTQGNGNRAGNVTIGG